MIIPYSKEEYKKCYRTSSVEETIGLARQIGSTLIAGDIVCFFGGLAAGKTTFIKGLVEITTQYNPHYVNSPTFSYLNIYQGIQGVAYHFDLYRLEGEADFLSMGFEEFFFDREAFCFVEWSERISSLLPEKALQISLEQIDETTRDIAITSGRFGSP